MSDREIMSGTHDCGADAAAYVLGALEPGEAEAFRSHVQECTVCRDEVDALRGVVHALPMSTPQYAAPRGLRRRVMRQLLSEQAAAGTSTEARGWSSGRARNRLIAGVAATVVAAAGVVTAVELAAGTAATVVQAQVDGISGSAQLRITGGRAELVVRNLTPPALGHVYRSGCSPASRARSGERAVRRELIRQRRCRHPADACVASALFWSRRNRIAGPQAHAHPVIVARLT